MLSIIYIFNYSVEEIFIYLNPEIMYFIIKIIKYCMKII